MSRVNSVWVVEHHVPNWRQPVLMGAYSTRKEARQEALKWRKWTPNMPKDKWLVVKYVPESAQ